MDRTNESTPGTTFYDQMQEKAIAFAIVFFILSQISERIANFIKLWWPWAKTFGGLSIRQIDPRLEKERELWILLINIGTGIFVSVMTAWGIYTAGGLPAALHTIPWEENKLLIGALMIPSGILISFGSKIWHDLLDLLYEVKRLRGKLVDQKTFEIDNIKDLITHLGIGPNSIVAAAIEQHGPYLLQKDGVYGVGRGFDRSTGKNVPIVQILIRDQKVAMSIGSTLTANLGTFSYSVQVLTIITNQPKVNVGGAVRVCNHANKNRSGSLGCLVKRKGRNEVYALSCYHVLKADHDWYLYQNTGNETIDEIEDPTAKPPVTRKIGELEYGTRNHWMDSAIARLNAPPKLLVQSHAGVKAVRKVVEADYNRMTPVSFVDIHTGIAKNAVVHSHIDKVMMNYGTNDDYELRDLTAITSIRDGGLVAPTRHGNSGAIVIDEHGNALGMVVGGDDKLSYLIHMTKILDESNLELA